MAELLKDLYNKPFIESFSNIAATEIENFDKTHFSKLVFNSEWKELELKARMQHIGQVFNHFLPKDFKKSAPILQKLTTRLLKEGKEREALQYMFLPELVAEFGTSYPEESLNLFTTLTQLASCEFAIRPFLINNFELAYTKLKEWVNHENHHVRRLVSEGSRPKLPWGLALKNFKKDPSPMLPILEKLKNDSSDYVRLSVSNHLNDICKDNPEIALKLGTKWFGNSKELDKVVKHGLRTLLKAGNREALSLFGWSDKDWQTSNLSIKTSKINMGDSVEFSFSLKNLDNSSRNLRLEYGIHFLRSNGTHNLKVFKISEKDINEKDEIVHTKKHSFKAITTRKYYPGLHQLDIIVNGKVFESAKFELINESK